MPIVARVRRAAPDVRRRRARAGIPLGGHGTHALLRGNLIVLLRIKRHLPEVGIATGAIAAIRRVGRAAAQEEGRVVAAVKHAIVLDAFDAEISRAGHD